MCNFLIGLTRPYSKGTIDSINKAKARGPALCCCITIPIPGYIH